MGNAIGKGNRHLFLTFLWIALYSMATSAVVGVIQINRHLSVSRWRPGALVWMIVFEVLDVFVGLSVAALAIAQASQVARNVTTNELANWHRYRYLQVRSLGVGREGLQGTSLGEGRRRARGGGRGRCMGRVERLHACTGMLMP